MTFERIPAELQALERWVVWCWEPHPEKPGEQIKPPYRADNPGSDYHASNKKPADWTTFEQAVAVAEAGKADGIGFALAPPYVGVDLDEELSENERWAIMLALASYSEVSPSGKGHHVILKASLNGGGRHPQGFGVFTEKRFWYCTGERVSELPATIEERQRELEGVLEQYLVSHESRSLAYETGRVADLDDHSLLEDMFASRSGESIRRLWEGDTSGYASHSEADLALCNHLAWWTARDAGRMDALFRQSGLYREEGPGNVKGAGYLARTIETAISATSGGYEGSSRAYWAELAKCNQPTTSEDYQPEGSGRSRGSDAADSVGGFLGVGKGNGVAESEVKDSATSDAPTPVEDEKLRTESDSADDADSVASGRPFALPVLEFIALERPKAEPLLADADGRAVVGRHSLILLGALGGHGKTTLFVDLGLHMAAGLDYPPFTIPRPVSILVIENEGPEELFAEKLAARLETFPHELKARFDVCTLDWGGFTLADEKVRERLIHEIAAKQYDLVFGDPLDSLGISGVGSPEDTRGFLDLMKQTGLRRSVAWWLNTHPRKEETKEALNEISGAWGGRPDAVLLLRMLEDDRTQIRQPKLRWARRGKGPTLLYAFDPDTEAFSYIGEQSEEERDYLAEIRALLADGKWRIVKEIAAPVAAGGIAANDKIVKKVLEEHPDLFESRTGEEAKELGRSPQATLWQRAANLDTADDDEDA